jgi:hypothetical protein
MVENHVVGLTAAGADVYATRTAAAAALPDAQMAADDIILIIKGQFIAHQTNATAWSRLAGNGQIAGGRHGGAKVDITTYI